MGLSLYALLLRGGKYYIGKSRNPRRRIAEHFQGRGVAWTRRFPPIKLISKIPNVDAFDEDKLTKMYMAKYGINNVRGGSYCQTHLTGETVAYIKRELATAFDKCYQCGQPGHFSKDCLLGDLK